MPKLPDFPHRPGSAAASAAAAAAAAGAIPGLPPTSVSSDPATVLPPSALSRFGAADLLAADGNRPSPLLDPLALHRKILSQKTGSGPSAIPTLTPGALPAVPPLPGTAGTISPAGGNGASPSLYEVAALTHELDTQGVTTKVKETLLANNIGQKVRSTLYIHW